MRSIITGIALSFVVAYSIAIPMGNFLHHWIFLTTGYTKSPEALIAIICVFFSIAVCIIGILEWISIVEEYFQKYPDDSKDEIIRATYAFIFFSYVFGAIATPFTTHGLDPLNWLNPWLTILLIAFVPFALLILDIARARKKGSGKWYKIH